jgi:4-aminobutyrate aminotransferase / (S)-3-amino-2-methylpropionate transaminase / 5-aminovalerate transaminase
LECGLLILTCGVYGDVVNLLTPLTTSEMIMKDGLDILEAAIVGNSGERNS